MKGNRKISRCPVTRAAVCTVSVLLFLAAALVYPWGTDVSGSTGPALAAKEKETGVKISLISQFFHFVTWPKEHAPKSGRIYLGFIGKSDIFKYRHLFSERFKSPGRAIKMKYITDLSQLTGCHALFISGDESYRLADILAYIRYKPILVIGDTTGFANRGVHINFFRAGDNLKFEINMTSVRDSGLVFSSKLYKLARIIEQRL